MAHFFYKYEFTPLYGHNSRYLFYAQKNNQSIQICAYTHRKNALIEIMCATAFRDLLISALEIVPPEITLHREMRVRNTWQGRLV